jgi:hypothetical protein
MALKWKNIRMFVLLAAMILGVSSIFVYLSIHGSMPNETEKTGLVPSPYFMPIPGQEVSLDQAQASAPFKIRLPTSTGSFVQLKQFIEPEADISYVYIIYAADKLSSNASIPDVQDHNGIILFEAPISAYGGTLQFAESNFRAVIDDTKDYPNGGNLQPVTINGYFGCAGGNVGQCVAWATETTYYELMANKNYPLQQLVAVAQSIPVN